MVMEEEKKGTNININDNEDHDSQVMPLMDVDDDFEGHSCDYCNCYFDPNITCTCTCFDDDDDDDEEEEKKYPSEYRSYLEYINDYPTKQERLYDVYEVHVRFWKDDCNSPPVAKFTIDSTTGVKDIREQVTRLLRLEGKDFSMGYMDCNREMTALIFSSNLEDAFVAVDSSGSNVFPLEIQIRTPWLDMGYTTPPTTPTCN